MTATLESASIEDLNARLVTLRADLLEAEQLATAAADRARDVAIRGRDDDGDLNTYLHDRAVADGRVQTLRESIQDLERLLPDLTKAATTGAAKQLMVTEHRAYAALLDQGAKDDERITVAVEALAVAVERKNNRHEDLTDRLLRMLVLAERFGLPMPDVERPAPPASSEVAASALASARSLTLSNPRRLPRDLSSLPHTTGLGWTLRQALGRIEGSPTADLLERSGPGILAEEEVWDRRRASLNRESRDRKDAARQAEIDRVDRWLKERLAEGPVLRDRVTQAAVASGIPVRGTDHATLTEALARVGVFTVVRTDDPAPAPAYWTTRRADGFEVPRDTVASALMAASMR